jgi:hypothetical protein
MILEGAAGSGKNYRAGVNSNGQVLVRAETQPHDRQLADKGKVWSLYGTATPTGAGDYFFYLKNTGTVELHITDIRIKCASAETFTYEFVSGTASGGTTLTPANRRAGSSLVPTATIESGADITGLTTLATPFFESCPTANKRETLSSSSNLHLPPGSAFAMKAGTGTALTTFVISLVEDSSSEG